MKLDERVVGKILIKAIAEGGGFENIEDGERFVKFLEDLDLVFEPGDSSQSTLVESK